MSGGLRPNLFEYKINRRKVHNCAGGVNFAQVFTNRVDKEWEGKGRSQGFREISVREK